MGAAPPTMSMHPSTPAKSLKWTASPIDSSVETAQSLERKTMQALEPFAQRIIARAVEAQAKLPTTPNIRRPLRQP